MEKLNVWYKYIYFLAFWFMTVTFLKTCDSEKCFMMLHVRNNKKKIYKTHQQTWWCDEAELFLHPWSWLFSNSCPLIHAWAYSGLASIVEIDRGERVPPVLLLWTPCFRGFSLMLQFFVCHTASIVFLWLLGKQRSTAMTGNEVSTMTLKR